MTMAPEYGGSRKEPHSELEQQYDRLAGNTIIGWDVIHEETLRREQNRIAREVRVLSYVAAFLAVAQVFVAIAR